MIKWLRLMFKGVLLWVALLIIGALMSGLGIGMGAILQGQFSWLMLLTLPVIFIIYGILVEVIDRLM